MTTNFLHIAHTFWTQFGTVQTCYLHATPLKKLKAIGYALFLRVLGFGRPHSS